MPPWRRCSRLPDVLVSLAEGPPGRADLARRRAITLQAGSHKDGSGTGSGPLLAIIAGQAAHSGLCRALGEEDFRVERSTDMPAQPTGRPQVAGGEAPVF